jgi:hypothetical protein
MTNTDTPLLLVSTATHWIGTARVPRALAKAGFEVALLTPRNALAEKSGFVSKLGYLPDDATMGQWVVAFAGAVEATAPRIVVPCDDMAFRLLRILTVAPPRDLQPALQLRLAALIRDSLGNPAWYGTSVDKTLLPPAAEALGVRVPPYAVVDTLDAAAAFGAQHGYPVVLKRSHGFAGQGVAICADRAELARAFGEFAAASTQELGDATVGMQLVQAHIPGRVNYYLATAWQGELLAGWASEKVVANPEPTGPPTVARYFRAPRLREITATMARGFGISGHYFVEFIVPDDGSEPYVLEINRRTTPGSHRGAARGADIWAALNARLRGVPYAASTDIEPGNEGISVFFPEEWLRDPGSRYLREYPVDVPWDEPELIEAFLAMRHER